MPTGKAEMLIESIHTLNYKRNFDYLRKSRICCSRKQFEPGTISVHRFLQACRFQELRQCWFVNNRNDWLPISVFNWFRHTTFLPQLYTHKLLKFEKEFIYLIRILCRKWKRRQQISLAAPQYPLPAFHPKCQKLTKFAQNSY